MCGTQRPPEWCRSTKVQLGVPGTCYAEGTTDNRLGQGMCTPVHSCTHTQPLNQTTSDPWNLIRLICLKGSSPDKTWPTQDTHWCSLLIPWKLTTSVNDTLASNDQQYLSFFIRPQQHACQCPGTVRGADCAGTGAQLIKFGTRPATSPVVV